MLKVAIFHVCTVEELHCSCRSAFPATVDAEYVALVRLFAQSPKRYVQRLGATEDFLHEHVAALRALANQFRDLPTLDD